MRTKIITLFILVIILIGGVVYLKWSEGQSGTIQLTFQLPTTQGLVAKVNDKQLAISGLTGTYKVHSGNQQFVATAPNYKTFSTSFVMKPGQNTVLNIAMQSMAPQDPAIVSSQLQSSLSGSLPSGFSIVNTAYFYSNTWVVATVSIDGGDEAILVSKYDIGSAKWSLVLGPGTSFSSTSVQSLPSNVTVYMQENADVTQGQD